MTLLWTFMSIFVPFLLLDYNEWRCSEHSCTSFECWYMFSLLLGVEFLGFMVILCWTFWGTIKLFAKVVTLFYIPTSNRWQSQFLQILSNNKNITYHMIYTIWLFKKAKLWRRSKDKWLPAVEIGWEKWVGRA